MGLLRTLVFTCWLPSASAGVVEYEVTFEATWSAATHPDDFPSGSAHFSGLIGATHQSSVSFWQDGSLATQGIKNMAELGSKSRLTSEINPLIATGEARSIISGGGIGRSPGSVSTRFEVDSSHPFVTLVSMIAPSPDWFVGVSSLNLREHGVWARNLSVDLWPYDAGTDSGSRFRSGNFATVPRETISEITMSPFDGTPRLGTFTFRLLTELPPADLTGNGFVDTDDLFVLLSHWNEVDAGAALGDLFDDPAKPGINADDLFVLLSEWTGPDPNPPVEAAFGEAAVPEPSSMLLAVIATLGLSFYRRRRRRAV